MGRRPNAVVLEFFQRGRKLEDASNRYEHTCKRCGQVFPRGRMDSLIGHVLRRCPNISQGDRDVITPLTKPNPPDGQFDTSRFDGFQPTDLALPGLRNAFLHQQQEQSALDTLAEVSRQQLDGTTHAHLDDYGYEEGSQSYPDDNVECELLEKFQQAAAEEARLQSMERSDKQIVHGSKVANETNQSPLVLTASAANAHLERVQEEFVVFRQFSSGALDPQLEPEDAGNERNGKSDTEIEHAEIIQEVNMDTSISPKTAGQPVKTPLTVSRGRQDGQHLKNSKGRPRNRFSEGRRKEVSEIRKRGACIRCRMLKKSCSEGTPCDACSRVESARLWKSKCLRTRLADECVLWSASIFHFKANQLVTPAIHRLVETNMPGVIHVRLSACSTARLSFSCKRYATPIHSSDAQFLPEHATLLIEKAQDLQLRVEEYVRNILIPCVNAQTNPLVSSILKQALHSTEEELTTSNGHSDPSCGRSCYSLTDHLATDVLELWVETQLLTTSTIDQCEVVYDEKGLPQQHVLDGENGATTTLSPKNQTLVLHQILALFEARCAVLSKNVVNELERRLLQRQQVSGFTTFILALLFLNCVERMTGLQLAVGASPSVETSELSTEAEQQNHRVTKAEHPRAPQSQGRHFAELLIMLLRMRGLPPSTTSDENGILVVKQNLALSVGLNGRPIRDSSQNHMQAAIGWLQTLRQPVDELMEKLNSPDPEPQDPISAWDVRFMAAVLAPSGPG